MKIYISGAITGHDREEVIFKFTTAQKEIESRGHQVLSPLDNGLPPSASWEHHMRADIAMMMAAQCVVMLPCWNTSRGAILEHDLAQRLYIPIIYYIYPTAISRNKWRWLHLLRRFIRICIASKSAHINAPTQHLFIKRNKIY